MGYTKPKGTQDLLPNTARAWEHFLTIAWETFGLYGYEPIETPLFEKSEVFTRGCGETTDVATKEIFSVFSIGALKKLQEGTALKADQKLALRPEGTASVVRAIAEHNLAPQGAAPAKLFYAGPMFRCERPQKGRLREFRQVGVECLGAPDPAADAEMIIMCMRFFEALGLPQEKMQLLINSMGCPKCRPAYTEAVREFMKKHEGELCDECKRRIEINPLRAFDCKNSVCFEVMEQAPKFSDYLCDECKVRYEQVKQYLEIANLNFVEDSRLVRGFDYYTGTVFEVQVVEGLGSQSAIGGGGRYDKLMAELGGPDVSGIGFAVGFERIMLALEAVGIDLDFGAQKPVYVAAVNDETRQEAFKILQTLRDAKIPSIIDMQNKSLKSQFKLANKAHARLCVVVGPDELTQSKVIVRNMQTHDENKVSLSDIVQFCA